MTPGIVFGASMTTSTGARHQLSVTVHFPGLSVASEASRAASHLLGMLERNCSHLPGCWVLTAVQWRRFWRELVFKVPFRRCHLPWEFLFRARGVTRAQKFNHASKNIVCISIHTACFGKCDFTPPPSAPLLLATALMEVLCPTLSILEKVLGPAQIALLSQMLETRSWLGDPKGPFCYDSRINHSQLMK